MQLDTGHFFVGDFLAFAIMGSIDFRPYFQAVRCGGVSNEADDYGQAFQGSAPPVFRDVAKHAVLDFVPFAGARREMTHL